MAFMRRDGVHLLLLAVFTLCVRLITTPELGTGGDAIYKWWNGKILLGIAPGEWEWSHHTARLGVMGPMLFFQWLFGTSAPLYFVSTFAVSILQALLMFRVATRLAGPALAFWATVALVLHPQMVISGAQLLPGAYSATYLLACVYFLLAYQDAEDEGTKPLLLASVAFFLAYLTKISNALYVPGFAAAMFLWHRRPRDLVVFAGTIAVLVAMEFVLYRTLVGIDRLQIIAPAGLVEVDSWLGLFDRYARLNWFWSATLLLYLPCTLGLAVQGIRGRLDRSVVGILFLPASFLIAITFAIRGIDPIIPAQPFFNRYFTSALPFFLLVIMLALQHAFSPIRARYVLRPTTPSATAAILAALLIAVFALHFPGYKSHPIVKLIEHETTVREFAGGTPVVSFDGRGWAAEAWLMLYWNESARPVRVARFGEDGLRGFWYTLATDDDPIEQALRTAEYDGEMIMIVSNQIAGHDTLGFRIERIRFSPEDRVWLRGGSSPPSGEID